MKFVLIVLMTSMGGGGMNQWRQPAITTATFGDEQACLKAMATVKLMAAGRDARLDYPAFDMRCLPESSGPATAAPK